MKKNIEVFDFNEEDELAESASEKLLEKFTNPSPSNSPFLQRQRIQSFCQDKLVHKEELEGASCPEAATAVVDGHCEDAPALVAEAEESTRDHVFETDADHGLMFGLNTEDHGKETEVDHDNHGLVFSLNTEDHLKETDVSHGLESFPCQPSAKYFYAKTSSYQPQLNSPLSDSSSSQEQTDMMSDIDESLSGRSALSEASDSEGDEDWMAEHCFYDMEKVGLIILRIRVLVKDGNCHEEMQHTTDIKELKFAAKEHSWPEKQQQVNSLHVKYRDVWIAGLDDDVEVSRDNLNQQKRYFPRFDEPFEDVIYPKGVPDAVSICKRDVELLQPETFVNDTIIDFYINYLKNQIQAEERHRFHFFNSFFFRKLADLDKDPSSIADGKAAFLRVRKWTRKVDMFGKDYIIVPVNFNLHWSLIVICHPGEVANCTDLDLDDSTKVPCILHMDSIKGSHAGLKNLVQSYLSEEWKERHQGTSDDISSRFMNLRFVSLEQENSYDCGLFLLHYLELFLAEAPQNFSPFQIYNASNFLYLNWFPPAEASLKRTLIQKLIFELLEDRSREVSNEQNQSCEIPVPVNNNNMGIKVLSGRCTPLVDCNGDMTQTEDDQGIEMTLLERSSMRNMQAVNDSGMVLRDLFDSGANNTGSLLGQLQQTFEEPSSFYQLSNNSLATEQVEIETGEQLGNFQRISGTVSPRAPITLSSWNLSMMPVQKEGEADSLSETSKSTSNDSEDIGIIEDSPLENIYQVETGESPPREAVSLFSATLGLSCDHNTENEELASTQEKLVISSSQDDRDEEKQLENDLGNEDKTSEHIEIGDKTSDGLGYRDKTSDELGIVDKTSDELGIVDKTTEQLEIEDKMSDDLGDDCDQKEKPMEEDDEKRAAKRPRLSSLHEVEKMEIQ